MLSTAGAVAAIAVMAIITFLTRALPFLLFDRGESPPKLVLYQMCIRDSGYHD